MGLFSRAALPSAQLAAHRAFERGGQLAPRARPVLGLFLAWAALVIAGARGLIRRAAAPAAATAGVGVLAAGMLVVGGEATGAAAVATVAGIEAPLPANASA